MTSKGGSQNLVYYVEVFNHPQETITTKKQKQVSSFRKNSSISTPKMKSSRRMVENF